MPESSPARWFDLRFGWDSYRGIGPTPWGISVRVIVFGWWLRFFIGSTFKPERLRYRKFYGYRLLALRLWGHPLDSRIIGFQWKRAEWNGVGRLVA